MKLSILFVSLFVMTHALADHRKDPDSYKTAKAAAMQIHKEGKKMPKGASEKAMAELSKICTKTLHKGCVFWKKGSDIRFQPLDRKGDKDGKIYELDKWLKKIFR